MVSRKKHSALILLCVWSVYPSVSFAQTLGEDRTQEALARETLRGLARVAVTIEDIAPDAEQDGLTENQLPPARDLTLFAETLHLGMIKCSRSSQP